MVHAWLFRWHVRFRSTGLTISGNALRRTQIKISLKTKDPAEARRRHAAQAASVQVYWDLLRKGPTKLNDDQVEAIAGGGLSLVVGRGSRPNSQRVGPALFRRYALGFQMATGECPVPGIGETILGHHVDATSANRCVIDELTRKRVLMRSAKGALQAIEKTIRECKGDWRPDPDAERFPLPANAARHFRTILKFQFLHRLWA